MTTCYFWRGGNGPHIQNFGDAINPLLLQQFAGISPTWAPAAEADIICCGSIIDHIPRDNWHGIVIGAGQLHESTITDFRYAQVLAVRGYLTLEKCEGLRHHPTIGDPGLLVSEMVNVTPGLHEIGVVPHFTDKELYPRELTKSHIAVYPEPYLIDVTADPLDVIRDIGSCNKIVASSLHGIIAADAFGIPRRAEKFPEMITHPQLQGLPDGTFKWRDYSSAIGMPIEFGTLQTAPRLRVQEIQRDLFETFTILKDMLSVR